jgi:hypothetical protein
MPVYVTSYLLAIRIGVEHPELEAVRNGPERRFDDAGVCTHRAPTLAYIHNAINNNYYSCFRWSTDFLYAMESI